MERLKKERLEGNKCSFKDCKSVATEFAGVSYDSGYRRTMVYMCEQHSSEIREIQKLEQKIIDINHEKKVLYSKIRRGCGLK